MTTEEICNEAKIPGLTPDILNHRLEELKTVGILMQDSKGRWMLSVKGTKEGYPNRIYGVSLPLENIGIPYVVRERK